MSDKDTIATLRQWAVDAQNVVDNWTGTTYTATKDAQLKELFRRAGLLMSHSANILENDRFAD